MTARLWFTGGLFRNPGDVSEADAIGEDAQRFGMTPSQIESLVGAEAAAQASRIDPDHDGVWPDNVRAVEAFLVAASQWRFAGVIRTGLDYAGAKVAWKALGLKVRGAVFQGVRIMEAETLRLDREGRA